MHSCFLTLRSRFQRQTAATRYGRRVRGSAGVRGLQLGNIAEEGPCLVQVGKYTFRADFDSGNLDGVRQGSSPSVRVCGKARRMQETLAWTLGHQPVALDTLQEFLLWTRRDCQDTDNERGTRSWFNFGVKGQQAVSASDVSCYMLADSAGHWGWLDSNIGILCL
jgi:hypothetical protein